LLRNFIDNPTILKQLIEWDIGHLSS
jgi:hypothetical protein